MECDIVTCDLCMSSVVLEVLLRTHESNGGIFNMVAYEGQEDSPYISGLELPKHCPNTKNLVLSCDILHCDVI